ncbi:hypothetical protein DPEC_G00270890 [Dallia pectoralis]|uniref:Uncharacterized protein n=1 Tax=Dallia pectoralis TaxID=75939 RepID=A0ACC2FPE4_DALPE|nr:hypothetical protein DPEC_G00270890 [Dallia pectoralis]
MTLEVNDSIPKVISESFKQREWIRQSGSTHLWVGNARYHGHRRLGSHLRSRHAASPALDQQQQEECEPQTAEAKEVSRKRSSVQVMKQHRSPLGDPVGDT